LGRLKGKQNVDGGGEDLITYKDPSRAGIGPSTPSQTAWGLMGLLPFLDPADDNIKGGIVQLLDTQMEVKGQGAGWPKKRYTGTGFPGFFYLRYTLNRHYFPMMALVRWVKSVGRDANN
jgi:squalene-hopene/tetraprenyl-beta-curcumene cyclase